ncbi:aminotransferase class III-fold pyridoxal phosphate-dependent enzyme [Nocardia puris]|uniref:aminotransferase class III-fold pyridoxal phosphate-dependent enzyme n=1 Tax=Nocardia puris TaxID=208602 RepID=UPI001894A7FC|nr:aminotransferase class III-fold pyridoxal phosphate-dependent enzyme [Nocardia puris]MBF6214402.1 aminotransferase class III-fold pyridoxal phosphate-dependent enzyme [Nocardia puris]MBF6369017.1 aminotransferase class III-fold pyridoxal phosphate-dependent enzyme [Nocardia puris]MBF6462835.1 aminotransferase class III-fold pyridoxal phosphate-dependent enzyme [Nocardia puris]
MTSETHAPSDRRARLQSELRRRLAAAHRAQTTGAGDAYLRHVNPHLARLLAALDLDKHYVRGTGTELYDAAGTRYLDFAGAYGALPFGHDPGPVWAAIERARATGLPVFVQPSILDAAGDLAARLAAVAPGQLSRVTFVNSGAEATEIAIKIARAATGRLGVLSTHDAFHGKTLGALSATGRLDYQRAFGVPVPHFDRIPFGSATELERALGERPGHYAMFLVEPIQGEGGVRVPHDGYLGDIRRICDRHGVLLAFDEVQTGLGRTGRMFAAEHDGAAPDILTVAKALGGGVLPMGAVLCRPEMATEDFALRHTSTFAGNALGARVGVAVLDELLRDERAVIRSAERAGQLLLDGLRAIAVRHPGVITDVRGRGLLIGVELSGDIGLGGRQGLIGSIADQANLAMVLTSYLLNVQRIRLAPTLFGTRVLRVEPPLTVEAQECETFLAAMESAIATVAAGDTARLVGHLVGRPPESDPPARRPVAASARNPRPRGGDRRFGFIAHPLDLDSLLDFDPALEVFDHGERAALLTRMAQAASVLNPAPFLIGTGRIDSVGDCAYGEIFGLPYTAEGLLRLPGPEAVRLVREAVDLALHRGADIVGLGAYSSIVTANGMALGGYADRITTGNSFTAAASLDAIRRVCEERGVARHDLTAAVLGGGGAIGRTIARALAREVRVLRMVGRAGATDAVSRLREAAVAVCERAAASGEGPLALAARHSGRTGTALVDFLLEHGHLSLDTDPVGAARDAEVVVAATSAPRTLLAAADFARDAVVCDVAQPPNIPADIARARPDLTVFDGGIVELPAGHDFGVRYGLPPGLTYACMAETMVTALSGERELSSLGTDLDDAAISRLATLADRHGFRLARATTWRPDHRTDRKEPR